MDYKIVIDAGHGGNDPGAVYEDRLEKDDVLDLSLAVGENLKQRGYDVEYTRTTDVYESPFEKATKANAAGADLFVSIHRNASANPNTAEGIETLVYNDTGIKTEIAESINEQLEAVGFKNRGVKERPNLVVLKRTEMPAVLLEVGFINSDSDNAIFDEKFDAMAQGIADGIINVIDKDTEKKGYRVQVGSYRNKAYAEELLNELLDQGYPAYLFATNNGYYRVNVGEFDVLADAVEMERELKVGGYPTLIVTIK